MVFHGAAEGGGLVGVLRECLVAAAREMPTRHPALDQAA